ncbi:MAG: PLP-dependent aspartate aminotransferase family protein [Firmicutes bacterium]|nr:PLP-dependent aspartate aminotransferase family protein [Bacillota bacterium]
MSKEPRKHLEKGEDPAWKSQTKLLHSGEDPSQYFGAAVPPIVQTSLFAFEDYEALDEAFGDREHHFIYTRGQNPTIDLTAAKIAALENGEAARLFSSGMAAISSTILSQVSQGDHIVCVKSAYGPTMKFLRNWLTRFGVETTFVDGTDPAEFEKAVKPNTRLFYVESPSSLVFEMQDLRAVSAIAKEHGIVTMIDNSWATPIFQKPLDLGIDLVVHSATKYLAGHSDVVAGVCVGGKELVSKIAANEHVLLGGITGPFEAWLLLRGLRTLDVRLERHQKNALKVAAYLEAHPKIKRVYYPGLKSHPQYELGRRQMSGSSGLMSMMIDCDLPGVRRFVDSLRVFRRGVSWGGFESLAYAPIISMAREQPEEVWRAAGVEPGLIRISVGLEDVEDIIADLDAALARV